jgi:non-ribosomal peptide synthetase component F
VSAGPLVDKADGRSLRSGFLANAVSRPDACALVVQGVSRTYGELDHTARVWAHVLGQALDRPPERVGVFGYRSEVSYTGVLAALFSGATFVPLNRTFPAARTRVMVEAANLDAIIVDRGSAPQISQIVEGLTRSPVLLCPEEDGSSLPVRGPVLGKSDLAATTPLKVLPAVIPDDTA